MVASNKRRSEDVKTSDGCNGPVKKKQKGSDALSNTNRESFEKTSQKISKLCSKVESSTEVSDFIAALEELWTSLTALRIERKLVTNYASPASKMSRMEAEAMWISQSFTTLMDILKLRVTSGRPKIAVEAFNYLMRGIPVECGIRLEKNPPKTSFPLRQLDAVVETLLCSSPDVFGSVLTHFTENFIQPYSDIRFYTLHSLDTAIDKLLDFSLKPEIQSDKSADVLARLSRHIYVLLQSFPSPKDLDSKSHIYLSRQFSPEGITNKKSNNTRAYKDAFCACWIHYLRLDYKQLQLSLDIYREILTLLPTRLLPFLESPLILTKFFLTAFKQNDISVAVQALSGLFYLLVKGRLGEPQLVDSTGTEFYSRLLSLLQPSVFLLPVRARFLRLLQVSLQSRMLSTHMRSLFVKKLVSVSLLTPPGASLWLLTFAFRLLQLGGRATMQPLILKNLSEDNVEKLDPLAATDYEDGEFTEPFSVPYRERLSGWEDDIAELVNSSPECRESLLRRLSLWELHLAKLHWHPSVMQLAKLFDADMFKPNAAKLKSEAFLGTDTAGMLAHELKSLLKKKDNLETIPLAMETLEADGACPSLSVLRAGCACL